VSCTKKSDRGRRADGHKGSRVAHNLELFEGGLGDRRKEGEELSFIMMVPVALSFGNSAKSYSLSQESRISVQNDLRVPD